MPISSLAKYVTNHLGLSTVHQTQFMAHFGEESLNSSRPSQEIELEDLLRQMSFKLKNMAHKNSLDLTDIERATLLAALGEEGKAPRTLHSIRMDFQEQLDRENLVIEEVARSALTKFANAL